MQLHPAQMSIRQFVPFTFVLSLVALAVISTVLPLGLWALAATLAAYLCANILTSVYLGIGGPKMIPLLIPSFAILHFSYGFGFMVGLLSFLLRWRQPAVASTVPTSR
jgi:hypothetical protein